MVFGILERTAFKAIHLYSFHLYLHHLPVSFSNIVSASVAILVILSSSSNNSVSAKASAASFALSSSSANSPASAGSPPQLQYTVSSRTFFFFPVSLVNVFSNLALAFSKTLTSFPKALSFFLSVRFFKSSSSSSFES